MIETALVLISPLIDPISTPELSIVFATMVLAGFMRGFVGFGSALIIIMIFSAIFGPVVAVATACLIGLPTVFQLISTAICHSERALVLPFAIPAFIAAPFGTLVLVSTDPVLMKIAISLFILAAVGLIYRGWRARSGIGTKTMFCFGVGAGLVQGAAGVGGPPVVALVLSRPGDAETQRANVIGTVSALALSSPVPLWYYGLFTPSVLILCLVLFPLFTLSVWAGARFFSGGGQRHFRGAALLMLAVIGMITLGLAVQDYLARG